MGFAPLSNEGTSLSSSFHRPRPGCFLTAFLEIRRAFRPIPFHRLHPRRSPSRGVATTSDSSCKAQIAFRPRRFTRPRRFAPPIARVLTELLITVQGDEGLADLLRSAANRRVRCVSFAHPVEPAPEALPLLVTFLAGHSDSRFPASKFVPPGGFPPPAAVPRLRGRCPLGLFVHLRSATASMNPFPASSFLSYQRDAVPRGLAPPAGPYHQAPFKALVGLPSLGLVPLRGRLHVGSFVPTELR